MATTGGWVYGLKIGLSVKTTWEVYQEAWLDDREITLEDADEMAAYGLKIGLIWGPELAALGLISSAPLYGVYAVIGVGFVASYAIGGRRGAEEFADYIFTPSRWGPTVRDEILIPVTDYVVDVLWEEQLVDPISDFWQTHVVDPITDSWLWNV